MVAKGEGGGGGKNWEFGISKCKLLHIEWINNKVLLYSTENYIQYPMIIHNGKEYKNVTLKFLVGSVIGFLLSLFSKQSHLHI